MVIVNVDTIAAYMRISCWSWLAWSKGWEPPGTHPTFIKWTGWTLAVAVPWWQHHKR